MLTPDRCSTLSSHAGAFVIWQHWRPRGRCQLGRPNGASSLPVKAWELISIRAGVVGTFGAAFGSPVDLTDELDAHGGNS